MLELNGKDAADHVMHAVKMIVVTVQTAKI